MKRIPGQDPERVLGVLEDCLRSVSTEIVREGRRITFFGLGPSPRAINRRDTTVIDVDAEEGVTTIGADVSFQASAFLGNTPQDVVVQEKLDRVFDQMRIQLGLDQFEASSHPEPSIADVPAAATSWETPLEVPPPEDIVPAEEIVVLPIVQPDAPSSTSPALLSEKSPKPREQPPVETVPVTEIVILTTDLETEAAAANTKLEPETTAPEPARAASSAIGYESATERPRRFEPRVAEVMTRSRSSISAKRPSSGAIATMLEEEPLEAAVTAPRLLLDEAVSDEQDEKKSRRLQWSAWAAAIVVLVIAPAAWLFLPSHSETRTPPPQRQQSPVPISQQAPIPVSQQAPVPPAPPAPKEPGLRDDLAEVVQEWEAAMGSSDAAAQAAFYADPVERYFLRHNVSKDQVVADKQAAIDRRHGTWAVKMEQVKVTRPDDAIAKVRLIKHFAVRQDGRLTSEWFIPSQLQLNRLEGKWRITSERDLGWATSMDELDY
ncbi:hypothetical protein [Edaphobacter modestus]|nr:hypothetical protein [Edaphobacter modestus]